MSKICLVVSSVFGIGGEQRVTCVIANELAKKHELTIYTNDDESIWKNNPYHLSEKVEIRKTKQPEYNILSRMMRRVIRNVNEYTNLLYRRKWAYNILEYAYFRKDWQKRMIEELNRESYNTIIAVSGSNSLKVGLIAEQLQCENIIGWEHNSFEAYFRTPHKYFWHTDLLFEKSARNLSHCVVLNDYIAGKYKDTFGVNCDVVYNPRSFVSEEKTQLNNKKFVACGRFWTQKGFDLLIDAFAEFAEMDDEWQLVLVGDGDDRDLIETKIRSYQLERRVILTGYTDKVLEYMRDASVYLLSSRWEGFPMVLTEAFEVGLPTVAFDITAVEPLITDGKEGLLAHAFDCKEFAAKMYKMTRLPKEGLAQMSEYAKEKAQSLAIENIMKQWNELIERQ